ncbi:MAG: alpha/beta hydrolase [Pseudomonadota bacterium]|nr:alpha/beta hydrolase [Pseudomonadota bacterium]
MEWQHNVVGEYLDIGDGIQMHYHERGAGGEPVIFLHGGGQGSGGWTNWKQNLDYFAAHGYHAIATDAIGYGLSSKPEDGVYDLTFLVDSLKKFVDKKGFKKLTLVGNSMGGAMSLMFAQRFPALMDKLVVMAPAGCGDLASYKEMPAIKLLFQIAQEPGGITEDKIRRLCEALAYDNKFVTDDLVAERFEVARSQPPAVFQTLAIPDLSPGFRDMKMPWLALWGVNDEACPVERGFDIVRANPNSQLVIYPECGHWVQAEKEDEFNRLCVEFLKSH